ncbi:GntR family transcriptional regulator [Sphingomonas sanguinis]|jgi:DNA-binding GntR family transcriptional regulator|uniref:GntR family transcriptional regulator n=1 Tax=Sphingomonas sp. LC-1 TaxID=3110957 RepID=UPI0021BAB4C2|nr:GntR family transcriptional regulator [Sphingomonas sp. LC-1]MCT8000393.1 GntR family transcriptional regulator [Sphingomonas sp. LC-1]
MSLVVRTLSEQIFTIIRERIISGDLPEEQPIRQDALANELGVSKIPLREALARLEQEGLLTSQANRGFFVRSLGAGEAEEIYELRLALEPDAAARASRVATDADQQAARDALVALDVAAHEALHEVALRNRAFHLALVRPLGAALTFQLIERLQVLAERYVVQHLKPAGRETRAHKEHHELLDAWLARDEARVAGFLTDHIGATLVDLRAQLSR